MHRTNIHRLVIGIAATADLAFFNYRVADSRLHDQVSALLIAIAFAFAALIVLTLTEDWIWRAVAVFISVGGTALSYWMISGRNFGWIDYSQAATRAILRASLDFGSVLLIICLAKFVYDRWRGRNVGLFDWLGPRNRNETNP